MVLAHSPSNVEYKCQHTPKQNAICVHLLTHHYQAWPMKLRIHSKTSMVQSLKFRMGKVISSNTLLGMWLFIHAGIKN